jgi:8-hydroxy-5-deazaflavin:NADPH oxidoreductase
VERLSHRPSPARPANDKLVAYVFDDAMLLAVPWSAIPDVMERIAPVSTGELVIDATNPLAFGPKGEMGLAIGFSTSGGEEAAKLAPSPAVCKR